MMNDDIEKSRVDYVTKLETQVSYLNKELVKYKSLADNWTPSVTAEVSGDGTVAFTLRFAGKLIQTQIPQSVLASTGSSDLAIAIAESFMKTMVTSKFKDLIEPEVIRMSRSASTKSTL